MLEIVYDLAVAYPKFGWFLGGCGIFAVLCLVLILLK